MQGVPATAAQGTPPPPPPDVDQDEHAALPPLPVLVALSPLEALSTRAHTLIAAFLPDGDVADGNRLRLSLASRKLLERHGGTLTSLTVTWGPAQRVEALARLVTRQHALEKVTVKKPRAIPALLVIVAQRSLCGLRELAVGALDVFMPLTLIEVRKPWREPFKCPGRCRRWKSCASLQNNGLRSFPCWSVL